MKKLLVLMPTLKMGGAQRALLSMLRELDKTKIRVTLVVFDQNGELLECIPPDIEIQFWDNYYEVFKNQYGDSVKLDLFNAICRLKIKYVYRRIKDIIVYRASKDLHEEQRIWKIVRDRVCKKYVNYDFCLSYMQGTATYYLVDKIVTSGKKLAMFNTDYEKAGYNQKFDAPYLDKLDNIICVSQQATGILKRVFEEYSEKIITVEDVVSPKEIQRKAKGDCIINRESEVAILVSCGRLEVEIKGYDYIVEVARKLSQDGYSFKWYIIGDGSGRQWIESKIREYSLEAKLILLGTVLNPYPIIETCDIFVHAARFEGKALVLKEAKFLKKPIITTNFDSAFSEIRNGDNGCIVEMDVDSIYKGVKKLLDNPEERDRLSANISCLDESGIEGYHTLFEINK